MSCLQIADFSGRALSLRRHNPAKVASNAKAFVCYVILASCSASSSQLLTARMTPSLAGIPFGKSACRSASRSTDLSRLVRARLGLLAGRLGRRRGVVVLGVDDFAAAVVRAARRLDRDRVAAPTTPCACLR